MGSHTGRVVVTGCAGCDQSTAAGSGGEEQPAQEDDDRRQAGQFRQHH
ncbi:hypothetical protein P4907_23880 [Escherichia coli]